MLFLVYFLLDLKKLFFTKCFQVEFFLFDFENFFPDPKSIFLKLDEETDMSK